MPTNAPPPFLPNCNGGAANHTAILTEVVSLMATGCVKCVTYVANVAAILSLELTALDHRVQRQKLKRVFGCPIVDNPRHSIR